jgi:energy-converting hydrogenase Eha subunit A
MESSQGVQSSGFWYRIAMLRIYALTHSRSQFHIALEVLFHASFQVAALVLAVLLLNLFGQSLSIDFALLGYLIGPLVFGALVAGHVRLLFPRPTATSGWIVAGVFGGATVTTFVAILALRDGGLEAHLLGAAFVVGAVSFMLLHWLFMLEARKSSAP